MQSEEPKAPGMAALHTGCAIKTQRKNDSVHMKRGLCRIKVKETKLSETGSVVAQTRLPLVLRHVI